MGKFDKNPLAQAFKEAKERQERDEEARRETARRAGEALAADLLAKQSKPDQKGP